MNTIHKDSKNQVGSCVSGVTESTKRIEELYRLDLFDLCLHWNVFCIVLHILSTYGFELMETPQPCNHT